MAFLPQSYRDGQPEPWEYLEASAIGACTVGMALTLTSGKLAKCTGETRPDYISMYGGTVAAVSKEPFHWTDTYVLDITDPKDALYVLMFVLAIDAEKCSRN